MNNSAILKVIERINTQYQNNQFMGGDCAVFAIALKNILGIGNYYAITNDYEPEYITHVVLEISGRYYDSNGEHSLEELMKEYKTKNIVEDDLLLTLSDEELESPPVIFQSKDEHILLKYTGALFGHNLSPKDIQITYNKIYGDMNMDEKIKKTAIECVELGMFEEAKMLLSEMAVSANDIFVKAKNMEENQVGPEILQEIEKRIDEGIEEMIRVGYFKEYENVLVISRFEVDVSDFVAKLTEAKKRKIEIYLNRTYSDAGYSKGISDKMFDFSKNTLTVRLTAHKN